MKRKVVACMVALVAIVALSVTAAQAGGQGGTQLLTGYFVCHGLNGGDLGVTVDIYTDEFGPTDASANLLPLTGVRVGSAVLACTQVRLTTPGAGDPSVNPAGELKADTGPFLKCYTASGSRKPGSPPGSTPTLYNATDNFDTDPTVLHDETDLLVSELRFLCTTANFSSE